MTQAIKTAVLIRPMPLFFPRITRRWSVPSLRPSTARPTWRPGIRTLMSRRPPSWGPLRAILARRFTSSVFQIRNVVKASPTGQTIAIVPSAGTLSSREPLPNAVIDPPLVLRGLVATLATAQPPAPVGETSWIKVSEWLVLHIRVEVCSVASEAQRIFAHKPTDRGIVVSGAVVRCFGVFPQQSP
jgi:hypothetical protein